METEENSNDRKLSEPIKLVPYQVDYDEIMRICEETGSEFEEVVRDLLHKGLRLRRQLSLIKPSASDQQVETRRDLLGEKFRALCRSLDPPGYPEPAVTFTQEEEKWK
jgi:hypothetical protein